MDMSTYIKSDLLPQPFKDLHEIYSSLLIEGRKGGKKEGILTRRKARGWMFDFLLLV